MPPQGVRGAQEEGFEQLIEKKKVYLWLGYDNSVGMSKVISSFY